MTVEIEPDPSRPLGGYARIVLPPGTLGQTVVSVTVYEMFKERYLGQNGWQPTEAAFGPYPVENTPAGQHFVIGPEIVNHLSEFAPVRLGFGSFDTELTWPDTVAVAPNAPPIGYVIGSEQRRHEPAPGPTPVVQPVSPPPRDADAKANPEPGVSRSGDASGAQEPGGGTGNTEPAGSGRGLPRALLPLVVLAVLALAGGSYYYWTTLAPATAAEEASVPVPEGDPEVVPDIGIEPADETVTEADEPTIEPEPAIDPCSAEALTAPDGDFATRLGRLRGCSGTTGAETALAILEAGVADGDADALLLFGHLYNPEVTDAEIEGTVGLSFDANLAVAIDYYSRARDAGSDEAAEALTQACDGLLASDPAAAEDFCE